LPVAAARVSIVARGFISIRRYSGLAPALGFTTARPGRPPEPSPRSARPPFRRLTRWRAPPRLPSVPLFPTKGRFIVARAQFGTPIYRTRFDGEPHNLPPIVNLVIPSVRVWRIIATNLKSNGTEALYTTHSVPACVRASPTPARADLLWRTPPASRVRGFILPP